MVDDGGVPPLPRRVPGASGSPRPTVRVELGLISEDLRQRVLTAIASELERDEAERRRNAEEQDGAGSRGVLATGHTVRPDDLAGGTGAGPANGYGASPASGGGAPTENGSGAPTENGSGAALENASAGPANGSSAGLDNGSSAGLGNGSSVGLDNRTGGGVDHGVGASPVTGPPWDQGAQWPGRGTQWPGTLAQQGNTPPGGATDRDRGAGQDAVAAGEPAAAAGHEQAAAGHEQAAAGHEQAAGEDGQAAGARSAAGGPDEAAPRSAVPLPRRAPGANGAPPPPAELRREYLPPSLLGRRLDPEAHTEPLPRISGPSPDSLAATGGSQPAPSVFSPIPPAAASGQAAPSVFTPTPPAASSDPSARSVFSPARPAAAPPAAADPVGSPAEPAPSVPGPSTAAPPAAAAESAAPDAPAEDAVPSETAAPDSLPPRPAPSASALAAASAPTLPVGSAALTAASAPTMPAGSAAMAAAAGFAPPAEAVQAAAGQGPPADLAAAPPAPADRAAPPAATSTAPPPPLPATHVSASSRPPAASPPAPAGYGWAADPGGPRPGSGRGAGSAMPLPAALPAKRPRRSGRPYRIAGVVLAVLALVVAGVIALVLSGGGAPGHGTGLGTPSRGAGAVAHNRAAAWVAGQVSRTAVVACDPVMCQALQARGFAASHLYQLVPQTTSPLRSEIIVATPAVRAQFGNVLSTVYAPAVLASFGSGRNRIDIRATAQHGAAAYRALLGSDLASRKASGTQLLHSGRIAAAAIARRELAAGEVDGRLLIDIAQMAATHPMFIVDFGSPAPGAAPAMPLRQADLAEDAHARHHAGRLISAGYVRSMLSFLHAQHGPFRPARVQLMRLAGGAAVLRIEFSAPSPLGLLGPHA